MGNEDKAQQLIVGIGAIVVVGFLTAGFYSMKKTHDCAQACAPMLFERVEGVCYCIVRSLPQAEETTPR